MMINDDTIIYQEFDNMESGQQHPMKDNNDDDNDRPVAPRSSSSSLSLCSSSFGSFHARPIRPQDRQRIQELHEDWFPVRYHDEFYDDLCSSSSSCDNNVHSTNNNSMSFNVEEQRQPDPTTTNNNSQSSSSSKNLVTRVITWQPALCNASDMTTMTNTTTKQVLANDDDDDDDEDETVHNPNHHRIDTKTRTPVAAVAASTGDMFGIRARKNKNHKNKNNDEGMDWELTSSSTTTTATTTSSSLPRVVVAEDDCSIRHANTKRQRRKQKQQQQDSQKSDLDTQQQSQPSEQQPPHQQQQLQDEKIVACLVGCFLKIPVRALLLESSTNTTTATTTKTATSTSNSSAFPVQWDEENPANEDEFTPFSANQSCVSLKATPPSSQDSSASDTATTNLHYANNDTMNHTDAGSTTPADGDYNDDESDDYSRQDGKNNQYHGLVNSETARLLISNPNEHDTLFYLMTLGTVTEFRKFGLATQLLQWLFHIIQRDHPACGAIYLHVLTQNQAAITLYERLGFDRVQEIPNYYTIQGAHYNCYLYAKYFHGNRGHWDWYTWIAGYVSSIWKRVKAPLSQWLSWQISIR